MHQTKNIKRNFNNKPFFHNKCILENYFKFRTSPKGYDKDMLEENDLGCESRTYLN